MRKYVILPVLLVFSYSFVWSQQQWDKPMQLKSCSIDIKADMFTATTFIEMEFYNSNDKEIEGLRRFELKPGQVITAFQLDLNGKYRDGSIEEKWKATNAYNRIVGKRIDPALLTMESPDHYNLRIYPVPAHASRKVTMTIRQLLKAEKDYLHYLLPLDIKEAVQNFRIKITVQSGNASPVVRPGLLDTKSFTTTGYQYLLEWNTTNILLKSPVAFSIPLSSTFFCAKQGERQTHFALRFKPSYDREYEVHPRHLTVLWDVSASSSKRDIKKEISFLRQFIAYHKIMQLTIIPFNYKLFDKTVFYTANNSGSRWQQYLEQLNYNGSTQLGCIDLTGMTEDMFMIFTDGNNTYGNSQPKTGVGLIYSVHTSPAANLTVLNTIVGSSGGRVIDLNKATMSDAISINSKAQNWLLEITSSTGKTIIEQSLPVKLNESLLINGTMNTINDTLIFHYGNNNHIYKVEKLIISANKECTSTEIDRITMLNSFNRMIHSGYWEDILDFGLKEKVVTPNTAYIVLERIEDYIKYNISPPAELKEECERMNYVKKDTRPQRLKLKEADEFDVINGVVYRYNDLIKKWDANEKLITLDRVTFDKEKQAQAIAAEEKSTESKQVVGASGIAIQSDEIRINPGNSALEEVVVVGYGVARKRELTGAVSYVRSEELRSATGTVEQALQGRVAGLHVTSSGNGFLNNQYKISLRGASSISGNSEPLFVLDGIPVSGNINDYINVNDIDNITVIRDASAAALYGSRAVNGAIVVTSKKGRNYYRNYYAPYRLKDMEDVEYLQDIKQAGKSEKKMVYERLKEKYEDEPGFYFDMAQHFFEEGLKTEAYAILMNAAEVSNGSYQVLRAMGYVLENWKQFDEAIKIYQQLADDYPGNLYSHRDLALAYYQNKDYQKAVDVLYTAIKNNTQQEWLNLSIKAMMLNELNAIIALHKDKLDISTIPPPLIRPLPLDLRIVLDCNKGSLGSVVVKEPGGAVCSYTKPVSKNGGMLNRDYNSYYMLPAEYQIRNASAGKYKVSLNYYDYYSYPGKIPTFVRMVVFKNFGKENQSIRVENVIMDNQYGEIEIGEVKW